MNIAEIDIIGFKCEEIEKEMGASESKSLGSLCSSSGSWEADSNNGGNACILTVEERKKKMSQEEEAVKDALKVAAGVAVVGWGLYRLFSSSSSIDERILMKAPGRKGSRIFRDEFEHDPSSYFKNLRNKDF